MSYKKFNFEGTLEIWKEKRGLPKGKVPVNYTRLPYSVQLFFVLLAWQIWSVSLTITRRWVGNIFLEIITHGNSRASGRGRGGKSDKNGRTHDQKHSESCMLATFWLCRSMERKTINLARHGWGQIFPQRKNDAYKTTERRKGTKRKGQTGKKEYL